MSLCRFVPAVVSGPVWSSALTTLSLCAQSNCGGRSARVWGRSAASVRTWSASPSSVSRPDGNRPRTFWFWFIWRLHLYLYRSYFTSTLLHFIRDVKKRAAELSPPQEKVLQHVSIQTKAAQIKTCRRGAGTAAWFWLDQTRQAGTEIV